jgi:CDP-paratose 2-epimerase
VRQHSPETVVLYSSTNKVYGDLAWVRYEEHETRYVAPDSPDGFDETIPLSFHSPYGCSKGAADQYMLDYARMFGLRTVVFRHSSMYGGRQFATYDQGWIGWFCQKAIAPKKGTPKEPFAISGDGKQVRDILCIDDVVALYFVAADHIETVKGEAFNIGGGMANSLSLLELFALLKELLDVKLSYVSLDWRLSDQRVFVANIGKTKRLLSWEPKISARDGVRQMLKWLDKTA